MTIIKTENRKTMISSAAFLIGFGLILFFWSHAQKNFATAFIGISFSFLSLICLLFILKNYPLAAKIGWGIGTPLLIFSAPLLYSLSNPVTISSYSTLYIGGMLFTAYSFQEKKEKPFMWISIGLFFLGLLFYDTIIIQKNFLDSKEILVFTNNYRHFKVTQVIHFITLVYLITLVHKNKVRIEARLSEQIRKLKIFSSSILINSKNKIIHSGNLLEALEEILRNTAVVLDVSRISIWEIDQEKGHLNMVVCYEASKGSFSYAHQLNYKDYPFYFKSLAEEKLIIANDVYHNSKTAEFAESYTTPLGIKSMMDAPFFMDGQLKGILCCEEQRSYKNWDEMDQLFSLSVSKLISIAYYCHLKKEHFKTVEKVNQKLEEVNGTLADNLLWKEKDLQTLKKFIGEMSFINAHQIRGPLSRILGLIHVYRIDPEATNRERYIGYMEDAAKELDDIIREIAMILNAHGSKED